MRRDRWWLTWWRWWGGLGHERPDPPRPADGAAVLVAAPVANAAATGTQGANHDGVLTAACAAFCQAQADFDVANAESGWSDAEINRLSDRWTAALNAVLASPSPAPQVGASRLRRLLRSPS